MLVGQSSWPQGKDYIALLSATTFMTPMDARLGKKKFSVKMFKFGRLFGAMYVTLIIQSL